MALAQLKEDSRHWNGAVYTARGYLRAVEAQSKVSRRNIAKSLLMGLRKNLTDVLKVGEPLLGKIKQELLKDQDSLSERDQQDILLMIANTNGALRACLVKRPSLLAASRMTGVYWDEILNGRLHDLLEGLEDIEETLALGLSREFRTTLEACRTEAGLEPIVPNGDSSRDHADALLSAGDQGAS